MNVWNVLDQFELKLIQIRYIQIRYIQMCIKIGWFRVNRTHGRNSSTSICTLNEHQKKFLIKSKKNWSQINPPENNVEPVPAKSQITRLRFGGNWLHIIFLGDCFGGSSDFAGTGSTLFSGGLFWRCTTVLYTKYVLNTKYYFPSEPKKLTQHHNFIAL